jgi:hypothetical protein
MADLRVADIKISEEFNAALLANATTLCEEDHNR